MTEATIFATALEKRDPAERSAYLDTACAGNSELRRRVDELLATHEQVSDYLERPAVEQMTAGAGLEFLQPSDQPGSLGRFADYEVQEVLGRSPFGAVVLKAFDARLHRVVAIKLLSAAADGPTRVRFLREARAAAAVRDDHVVAMHAVADEPVPYLVMEYVAGQTLQQKLDRGGPLELRAILRIGVQIARGLAAIHAQGMVHRDIKPANILLENGVERVKITDFGLARPVDITHYTHPGIVAGTPNYMSPEQAQGEPVDQRSDLFSLGSVLYALCTGRPPFRAADTLAVLRRVIDDTPRPVRTINPEMPAWLSDLIERLHAKRPADRPQSAREVVDLLAGQLAALQMPGSVPPVQRPGRGRRWVAAVAVALFAIAGLGMTEATGLTQMAGTVIRLFNPDGTLVVETDDPNVSVAIDGKELVITGAGPHEIRLRPGAHQVNAVRDGMPIDEHQVTIERNGRAIVRIRREPAKAPVAAQAPVPGTADAAQLIMAFRTNAAIAGTKYLDRRVVVSGRMIRIRDGERALDTGKKIWGRSYVLEMASGEPADKSYLSFQFFFPETQMEPQQRLAKLQPGQEVMVEGLCKGWLPEKNRPDERECIFFWDSKLIAPGAAATKSETAVAEKKTTSPLHDLAEWVRSVGGSVRVKFEPSPRNTVEAWYNAGQNPPANWFSLTGISLTGCKKVRDDDLARISVLTELTVIRLEYLPITDAGLAHVVQAQRLEQVYLRNSAIGDGAIPLLAKLPKLEVLDASDTKITEAGLKHLDELGKVSTLALRNLPVTDAVMPHLAELTFLTDLDLAGTGITAAGVRQLARLDRLYLLSLGKTALTDAALAPLADLRKLYRLNLEGTRIKGDGLKALADLPKLQELNLSDTPLTDAALEPLAGMKGLRQLALRNTQVTPSGIARLRRALPQCQVISE